MNKFIPVLVLMNTLFLGLLAFYSLETRIIAVDTTHIQADVIQSDQAVIKELSVSRETLIDFKDSFIELSDDVLKYRQEQFRIEQDVAELKK